jgi:hypothetical protein
MQFIDQANRNLGFSRFHTSSGGKQMRKVQIKRESSVFKNRVVAAALVATMLASTGAIAQSTTGKVTGYIPYANGNTQIFLFSVDSNLSGGCNTTARYTITSASAQFKSVQAAVMAAFHSQTPVMVYYSSTCNGWGNSWDLNSVCIGTIPC